MRYAPKQSHLSSLTPGGAGIDKTDMYIDLCLLLIRYSHCMYHVDKRLCSMYCSMLLEICVCDKFVIFTGMFNIMLARPVQHRMFCCAEDLQ